MLTNRTPEAFNNINLITLITGPMFAGKSQELLNRLHLHEIVKRYILLINSTKDTRIETGEGNAAGVISTHRKNSFSLSECTQIAVQFLNNIDEKVIMEHEVIGIDEGQFFTDIELVI